MEDKQDKEKLDADTDSGTGDGFDIEPILQALGHGGVGLYQCLQMALQLSCLFSVACSIMSVVFIGYKPPYQCASVNTSKLEALVGWSANCTGNMTVSYGQCSITVQGNHSGQLATSSLPCVEGFEYEGDKGASFFSEWDLTCEKSALTELTQTLMMGGQALGGVVFTSIADQFGRKPVYASCSFTMLILAGATALSPNYVFFIVCRVLTGAIQQGSGLIGFTMFIELLPKRLRGAAGVFDGGLWSFSLMFLPALAYLMRNYSWRHLQFIMAASSLYSLILPWCIDESLRWLVANKKTARAERILKKASRLNRVPYQQVHQALHTISQDQPIEKTNALELANENKPEDEVKANTVSKRPLLVDSVCVRNDQANGTMELRELSNGNTELRESADGKADLKEPANGNTELIDPANSALLTAEKSGDVQKYTPLDIFRSRCLLKTLLTISYLWITNSVTYYGLMLTSASLAGNRYLNFFLQALMEFPAYVSAYFLLRRFGRRHVSCGFLCLTALCLLLSSVITATVKSSVVGPITNALSLLGKYAISGSFSVLFIYCPELFPTNLRTSGLGISSGVARFGSMVAPFTNNLAAVELWAPGILFGGMALLAAVSVMRLPETRGRPMPTTIEDMKLWYGNSSKKRNKEQC